MWGIIGVRMGFAVFSGSDHEPARSGPGVAQRLAQVYRQYLMNFDMVYINSVYDSRKKLQAAAQAHAVATGTIPPSQPLASTRGAYNAQQMQLIVGYANQTAAELRAANVPEGVIQFVEANRAHLQRTVIEQGMFRGQFQGQRGPQDQPGMPAAGGPFAGSPAQPNPGTLANHRQQLMQQQQLQQLQHQQQQQQHNGMLPMQGNNPMDNRQQQPQPQMGNIGNGSIGRPTKEQMNQAVAFITKAKKDFQQSELFLCFLFILMIYMYQTFRPCVPKIFQRIIEGSSPISMNSCTVSARRLTAN